MVAANGKIYLIGGQQPNENSMLMLSRESGPVFYFDFELSPVLSLILEEIDISGSV